MGPKIQRRPRLTLKCTLPCYSFLKRFAHFVCNEKERWAHKQSEPVGRPRGRPKGSGFKEAMPLMAVERSALAKCVSTGVLRRIVLYTPCLVHFQVPTLKGGRARYFCTLTSGGSKIRGGKRRMTHLRAMHGLTLRIRGKHSNYADAPILRINPNASYSACRRGRSLSD